MSEKFPVVLYCVTLVRRKGGLQCEILNMPARLTSQAYLTASKRRVLITSLGKIVFSAGDWEPTIFAYTDDSSQLDALRQRMCELMREKCEALVRRASNQLMDAQNPDVVLTQEEYTDHLRFG